MPSLATTPDLKTTTTSGTLTTASFTPAVGEILVIKVLTEDAGFTATTPTGGGLTYTNQVTDTTASHCAAYIWTTTTTSASSMTVSTTISGATGFASMVVERWTSAQLAGTPATVDTRGTGSPSTTLTTTAASSVVSWCNGDFAANNPAGRTYNTTSATPTEDGLHDGSTTHYVAYHAWQTAASAGSQTLGITAPTGQTWTLVGIEIQDAPASGPPNPNQHVPPPAQWFIQRGLWLPWQGSGSDMLQGPWAPAPEGQYGTFF